MDDKVVYWIVKYDNGRFDLHYGSNSKVIKQFDYYPDEEDIIVAVSKHLKKAKV